MGDQLHDMIVSGQVAPDGEPADEAERQIAMTQRHFCMLAQSFASEGFLPVLDWVVRHKPDLKAFVRGLSGVQLHLVVFAPPLQIVAERKARAFNRWAHLEPTLSKELSGTGLWVDSSDLTAEQTVDCLLANKLSARL